MKLRMYAFVFLCLLSTQTWSQDSISRVSMGIKRGYFFSVAQPESYWNPTLGVYMTWSTRSWGHGIDIEFIHATFPKVLRKVRAPGISYSVGWQFSPIRKVRSMLGATASFRIGYTSLYPSESKKIAVAGLFYQNTVSLGPTWRLQSYHLRVGHAGFVDVGLEASYLFDLWAYSEYSDIDGESHRGVMPRGDRVLKHSFSMNVRLGWGKEIRPTVIAARRLPT